MSLLSYSPNTSPLEQTISESTEQTTSVLCDKPLHRPVIGSRGGFYSASDTHTEKQVDSCELEPEPGESCHRRRGIVVVVDDDEGVIRFVFRQTRSDRDMYIRKRTRKESFHHQPPGQLHPSPSRSNAASKSRNWDCAA
jgi:hypothetical protein